ncbi:hypothetical protein Actkin_05726 [Actinokineospora sp. UTMC 2448]|nr:hypothetical protein Actkin_05726 [Actinokineospora sp. UTMC 2448]
MTWRLRWSPSPAVDGLGAFEGVEDDRAGSHPGVRHIAVVGDVYRFTMHAVDRDRAGDRQRQEVKGMRAPSGGPQLVLGHGETWWLSYRMRIPRGLAATTGFTHVFQTKAPGKGTLPMVVMSLRLRRGVALIELKVGGELVGETGLDPLYERWVDVDLEMRLAENGWVRWRIHDDARAVIDVERSGVDTWLPDRVRPKWGIYRSLRKGPLPDCHLEIRDLRAYQWTR